MMTNQVATEEAGSWSLLFTYNPTTLKAIIHQIVFRCLALARVSPCNDISHDIIFQNFRVTVMMRCDDASYTYGNVGYDRIYVDSHNDHHNNKELIECVVELVMDK